ncbi:hypothetical protein PoB_003672800, partial [Plakobranchus ocellatus]
MDAMVSTKGLNKKNTCTQHDILCIPAERQGLRMLGSDEHALVDFKLSGRTYHGLDCRNSNNYELKVVGDDVDDEEEKEEEKQKERRRRREKQKEEEEEKEEKQEDKEKEEEENDLSDTENYEFEEGRYPGMRYPPRRTSYDVSRPYREQVPPYRRSHSLAELQAEREREKLAAQQEGRPVASGSRATERRSTLSSLVFSSLAALDQTGNAVIPPYVKKKHK